VQQIEKLRVVRRVSGRAVVPEPKQFWMAGSWARNLVSGFTDNLWCKRLIK